MSPRELVVEARPWDAISQGWPDALSGELTLQAVVNFTASQRRQGAVSKTLPLMQLRLGDQPAPPPSHAPANPPQSTTLAGPVNWWQALLVGSAGVVVVAGVAVGAWKARNAWRQRKLRQSLAEPDATADVSRGPHVDASGGA